MSEYAMSPALVESGDIFIEVYPMKVIPIEDQDCTESRLIEQGETPDFYDVWLRPDDWDLNNGSAYGEWEDLTRKDAEAKIAELEQLNPGITVNWVTG